MNNLDFLKQRQTGIGGSDIAAILNIESFKNKTAYSVYLDKTQKIKQDDTFNLILEKGNALEPLLLKQYELETGRNMVKGQTFQRHEKVPYFFANIDGLAVDPITGEQIIIECKTVSYTKRDLWGEPFTDQIPSYYKTQVAWYCFVLGIDRCDIAVLIGDYEFRIYTYKRDKDFEQMIVKHAHNFWLNHVQKQIPPCVKTVNDINIKYKNSIKDKAVKVENKQLELINRLKNINSEIDTLKKESDSIKNQLKEHIKDNEVALDEDGNVVYTWKKSAPRKRFNEDKFEEDNPELYEEYLEEKEGIRIFRVN